MLKQFHDNPKLAQTLKDLVQQNNGKKWPEIAKVLESIFSIEIDVPFNLKTIYEDLVAPDPKLDRDQLRDLVLISIKHKSVIKCALPEFKSLSNMEISRHKFCSRLYRFYKNALIQGINVFMRNKSEYRKRLSRFPGQSIGRVLQCKDLKAEDSFTLKLKDMAYYLETLFTCYLDWDQKQQDVIYEMLVCKMNKQTFFLLLNCVSFMDDLRCISLNLMADEDLMPDYWLQPTVQQNKDLHVYQYLFLTDWTDKFEMYTTAKDVQTEYDFKLYFNNQVMKPKGGFQTKIARKKTVRGKITVNDKKYPNDRTIRFEKQLEQEEEEKQLNGDEDLYQAALDKMNN